MSTDIYTAGGRLSSRAIDFGYVENIFGELRTVTLARTAPGCDYVVTVQAGVSSRLARRANFTRLDDARKFARAVLSNLAATPANGVDTL